MISPNSPARSTPFFESRRPTTPFLSDPALAAFRRLRSVFAPPVALRHFDASLPTVVETDSSRFAIAAILSQLHPDGYRPVAYWSRQTTDVERRYLAHDSELLAVVEATRHWTTLLESCNDSFTICTDTKLSNTSRPLNACFLDMSTGLKT